MRIVKVIESKRWRNVLTNATASIYGAVPYQSDADRAKWVIELCGYTWLNDNGTVGLGRAPAKTMEEALQVMAQINSK